MWEVMQDDQDPAIWHAVKNRDQEDEKIESFDGEDAEALANLFCERSNEREKAQA